MENEEVNSSSIESNYEPESDENEKNDENYQEESNKKYKCEVPGCKAIFPRPSRLERHMNVHTNKRPYKCTHKGCDRAYTNSSHLKRHLETHNIISKSFQCNVCKASMSTYTNLKRHYKRTHDKSRELYCLECKKWFKKKNRFEEHMKMHENSSTFKCEKCGKIFKTDLQMMNHLNKHQQKKTYKCPVEDCTQVFDRWLSMLKHKRTEHTLKFSCSVCHKNFATRDHLRDHKKTHVEDRPVITCPYKNCNRIYYFRKNLTVHIRSKHIGLKYKCDICKIEVTTKQKIREHIIKKHLTDRRPVKRKPQSLRKDAGMAKRSIISSLTGIKLGVKASIDLMKRPPAALIRDQMVEDSYSSSFSEDDRALNVRIQGS